MLGFRVSSVLFGMGGFVVYVVRRGGVVGVLLCFRLSLGLHELVSKLVTRAVI